MTKRTIKPPWPPRPASIATVADMRPKVGAVGTIDWHGARFEVSVLDVRSRYGQTDYLVTPVAGDGSYWTPNVRFEE